MGVLDGHILQGYSNSGGRERGRASFTFHLVDCWNGVIFIAKENNSPHGYWRRDTILSLDFHYITILLLYVTVVFSGSHHGCPSEIRSSSRALASCCTIPSLGK